MNRWRSEITTRAGHRLVLEELFDAMDGELLSEALYAALHTRESGWTDQRQAQHVWNHHCERYLEKHGVAFPPDMTPAWSSMIPDSHIFTTCGTTYMLPRVWWFMNPALRAETVEALLKPGLPPSDSHTLAQRAWDDYCGRHQARLGEPFAADRDPAWSDGKPGVFELLFPIEIVTGAGHTITFGDVSFYIDPVLFNQARQAASSTRAQEMNPYAWTLSRHAQETWNHYCTLHHDKYGKPYPPDAYPEWNGNLPTRAEFGFPLDEYIEDWCRFCEEDDLARRAGVTREVETLIVQPLPPRKD